MSGPGAGMEGLLQLNCTLFLPTGQLHGLRMPRSLLYPATNTGNVFLIPCSAEYFSAQYNIQ